MKNVETAARETLEKVMADVLLKSGSTRSAVQAVCLAVSGVNHPTDQYRILGWLRFLFCFVLFSIFCLCLPFCYEETCKFLGTLQITIAIPDYITEN